MKISKSLVEDLLASTGKIGLVLLGTLIGMSVIASEAQVATEGDVLNLLRGYEWQLDIEALKALPSGADKALIAMVRGDGYPVYIKSRAVAALGHFPSDMVLAFLTSELATADPIERRRIVDTICQGFSADRPGQVEVTISDYLEHRDAHLRVNVARCLQRIGSGSAMEKVRRYQKASVGTVDLWEREALNR